MGAEQSVNWVRRSVTGGFLLVADARPMLSILAVRRRISVVVFRATSKQPS
jgi:hypothetical protein